MQESGESLESFHAALTAQAVRSELGTLESEIVRDLFVSKKNMTLQDTLTFETFETNAAATVGTGNNYNSGVSIKQEPVMAARNSTGNTKNQQNKREANKRQNNDRNSNGKTKPCYRCGGSFDQGHLKNCSALGKTCKNCGKPNHFSKM